MKPAYSMWSWAVLTSSAGITFLLAPQFVAGAVGMAVPAPDSTQVVTRLLGIALIGYGSGYGVAAVSDGRAFMRVSVMLRMSILPLVLALVAIGWLPAPLLALGIIDLAGALWTRHELRQCDRAEGTPSNPAPRNVT